MTLNVHFVVWKQRRQTSSFCGQFAVQPTTIWTKRKTKKRERKIRFNERYHFFSSFFFAAFQKWKFIPTQPRVKQLLKSFWVKQLKLQSKHQDIYFYLVLSPSLFLSLFLSCSFLLSIFTFSYLFISNYFNLKLCGCSRSNITFHIDCYSFCIRVLYFFCFKLQSFDERKGERERIRRRNATYMSLWEPSESILIVDKLYEQWIKDVLIFLPMVKHIFRNFRLKPLVINLVSVRNTSKATERKRNKNSEEKYKKKTE